MVCTDASGPAEYKSNTIPEPRGSLFIVLSIFGPVVHARPPYAKPIALFYLIGGRIN
jgi:hypothetical protein